MLSLAELRKELSDRADPEKARIYQRFFKTGPGQYGEGDIFLGITVPQSRAIAGNYNDLAYSDIKLLLTSRIHEERLISLLLLVRKITRTSTENKEEVVKFYLDNIRGVNNWDLVDLSAPRILGEYLRHRKDRRVLYNFARSGDLWKRRIAIITTLAFIRDNDFHDALKLSEILVKDEHDLIQKAVGWTLREIGKKEQKTEELFLKKYHRIMPRTMLRYSIERFPQEKRIAYLKGLV
ncbi:MAG: DNA alkylation repair protein [Nitrososphaerales archaeon]